jgi:hypothetical protein
MMKKIRTTLFSLLLASPFLIQAGRGDTLVVQTFTFDSIITRRATFQFPEEGGRYQKILMYYTLKCDSLTPHDKYPCGEWDYTTYTRVYHETGKWDSTRLTQPSFIVEGRSPKEFQYSENQTWSYYEYWDTELRMSVADDHYLKFSGTDYVNVPGEAFSNVKDELTVAFWLNGDVFSQPMASTIFEGLDKDGKRVINLHVPYDNGVVYWDAGGRGEGLTDNINKAAQPADYKGRWTHWAFTKNSKTGKQRIYMNGKLFEEGDERFRKMDGISKFRIGSNGLGTKRFYQGGLDDFAVWNRELDSADIANLTRDSIPKIHTKSLLLYYDFDHVKDQLVMDNSRNSHNGVMFGNPEAVMHGSQPYPNVKPLKEYNLSRDSIPNPMLSLVMYEDSLNPSKPTDTLLVWSGQQYLYNGQGLLMDSIPVKEAKQIRRKTHVFYSKPFEVVEPFEIARFITPYGKRLDLGLNGFTWVYDVTDYEPLLHGQVDLQAANGQELLDLRFLFIEGIPPRDVISVQNIWPEGSYKYKDLSDDEKLKATAFRLSDTAVTFKLRARISGHGHSGPYNCCEWDPKKHKISVNGETKIGWRTWRDCGMNPVHPQGGTWQFDRAGWCPGTFVDTYDFELTPYVKPGDNVVLDYSIEPYDPDNGEEGGNYEMAMQIFEYSIPNFETDIALEEIMAPSDRHEYRRMNPLSLNPVIRIKNTGRNVVKSLAIEYGLTGEKKSLYDWTGELGFMEMADIILPKPSWEGMNEEAVFEVVLRDPNGLMDEYPENNRGISRIGLPHILPATFIIHVKTQKFGRAADNACSITNDKGENVWERNIYQDDSTYNDLVRLKEGAYRLSFTDKNEDGMIRHWWLYWSDPEKVGDNGELKIFGEDGKLIMDLGYDWAEKREIQFFVGEPQ